MCSSWRHSIRHARRTSRPPPEEITSSPCPSMRALVAASEGSGPHTIEHQEEILI